MEEAHRLSYEKRMKIISEHPNLYAKPIYFECYDGWLDLIERMSNELELTIIEYKKEFPTIDIYPMCDQVKEKYGTLRFYMNVFIPIIEVIINEYCRESASICEICGQKGDICKGYWYKVRCEEHSKGVSSKYQPHVKK